MKKLERLIQNESGQIFGEDKHHILSRSLIPQGKIRTIVIKNPCLDISSNIDEMIEKEIICFPPQANSYVISDFNGGAQYIKECEGKEEVYSIYAIQFYYNFEGLCH